MVRARMARRLDREDGLGLVELMMSILIIGIILSALAGALVTSLRTVSNNEAQVLATALHQEVIEEVLAKPWEVIGAYTSDPDYVPTVTEDGDTFDTVTLTGPVDSRAPELVRQETRRNRTYDIRLDIYWVDSDGDGTNDTKRLRTTVSWTSLDGTRRTEFHALRAPTAEELPKPFEMLVFEPSPNQVALDEFGATTAAVTFTIKFNEPATSATVSYETPTGTATLSASVVSGDATHWSATLPSGTQVVSGDQLATAQATSTASPPSSATSAATVTFVPYGSPPPSSRQIHDILSAPNPLQGDQGNSKACDFGFTVRVRWGEPTDVVRVTYGYWEKNKGSYTDATDSIQLDYSHTDGEFGVYTKSITNPGNIYFLPGRTVTLIASATPADESVTVSKDLNVGTAEVKC